MAVLILRNIKISASDRDYVVEFSNNLMNLVDKINKLSDENSFFIIDQKFNENYSIDKYIGNKKKLIIKSSEKIKSLEYSKKIVLDLKKQNINKKSKIFAIGGGTLQDVVQFTSSILFRGVEFFFIPTTLQAITDSCIGSKTSINLDGGIKNQLGTFYSPTRVLVFTDFIKSLPKDELKGGYAELIKLLIIGNYNNLNELYFYLNNGIHISNKVNHYVQTALKVKKIFIEIDQFDNGIRKILNYGHSFAHSIETLSNHKITHGNATALGINIANYYSLQNNLITEKWFYNHFYFFNNFYNFKKILNKHQLDGRKIVKGLVNDKKIIDKKTIELIIPLKDKIKTKKVLIDRNLEKIVDDFIKFTKVS